MRSGQPGAGRGCGLPQARPGPATPGKARVQLQGLRPPLAPGPCPLLCAPCPLEVGRHFCGSLGPGERSRGRGQGLGRGDSRAGPHGPATPPRVCDTRVPQTRDRTSGPGAQHPPWPGLPQKPLHRGSWGSLSPDSFLTANRSPPGGSPGAPGGACGKRKLGHKSSLGRGLCGHAGRPCPPSL